MKLEDLANQDGLTGLLNRRTLDERLTAEFERATRYRLPLSVVLLGVDDFKQTKDRSGRASGDQVLRQLGQLIAGTIRKIDVAARYGDEEIVILLPKTDGDGAMLFTMRLHEALRREIWTSAPVTASLGVATLDATTRNSRRLADHADMAMREAKRTGRDRIVSHRDVVRREMSQGSLKRSA